MLLYVRVMDMLWNTKMKTKKKQSLYRKETTAKRAHIHIAVFAKNARGYILIHKFTHSQING